MEKNNYDHVAAFYDQLSVLIFGRLLRRAQTGLIEKIPPGASVLIAGGGTGWILEEIAKVHPDGLDIKYVEISARMLARAKLRKAGCSRVTFIQADIATLPTAQPADVIFTAFLFDNFSEATAENAFLRMHELLTPGGLWLFADFDLPAGSPLWQRVVLRLMYIFFRLLCNVEATKLPDMRTAFNQNGYSGLFEKTFCKGFIRTVVFKKPA